MTSWLATSTTPDGDGWLSPSERVVQAGFHVPKRRQDWRLGRWAAKCAVAAVTGGSPGDVVVVAADDGAPEALDPAGAPLPVVLSISHRAGRAVAAVAPPGVRLGIDLEIVEDRHPAFVDEWYAPEEQALLAAARPAARPIVLHAIWTAKEAAAKAYREGLRLDVRRVVATLAPTGTATPHVWHACEVVLRPGALPRGEAPPDAVHGWWRHDEGWVVTAVTVPAGPPPVRLAAP